MAFAPLLRQRVCGVLSRSSASRRLFRAPQLPSAISFRPPQPHALLHLRGSEAATSTRDAHSTLLPADPADAVAKAMTVGPLAPAQPTQALPEYKPATRGVLTLLPASWVPYAELSRIDKPGGFYGFYFPYLIGMGWAGSIAPGPAIAPSEMLYVAVVLAAWTVVHRGAACTANDALDAEFDRQVERCRLRPVARGAVTPARAWAWYGAQCAASAGLVAAAMPHPAACLMHAVPIVFLLTVYPLFKRWTHYPQLVLSLPLAWAVPLSCAALGLDLHWAAGVSSPAALATASLVISQALWIVQLDYVNALQDTRDDLRAGVKSMAVRFRSPQTFIAVLGGAQVALKVASGLLAGLSPVYFLGACGGNAFFLAWMAATVTRSRPDVCAWWFLRGSILVGGTTTLALFLEYATRLAKPDQAPPKIAE